MGYFKSKSHKKSLRIKKNYLLIMIIFILVIMLFKVKIPKKYVNFLFNSYLQMNYSQSTFKDAYVFKETNDDKEQKPLVFIYSTHQREKYKTNIYNSFNIENDINFADYLLKEYLEKEGITSLTLKYDGNSYDKSRVLLENAYQNNPTLKYFIDIHRDSGSHELTTCDNYAKVLFVIGKENENYQENEKFAQSIHTMLKEENDCFSRGILLKSGPNVNGIYNQDFSKNAILIEVGGEENYIEEVNETMKVLAKVLSKYIKENTL